MLALRGPETGRRRAFFEEVVGDLGRVHVTAADEATRTAKARARKRKQRREVGPTLSFGCCCYCCGGRTRKGRTG
jgi:hypothetical protein